MADYCKQNYSSHLHSVVSFDLDKAFHAIISFFLFKLLLNVALLAQAMDVDVRQREHTHVSAL